MPGTRTPTPNKSAWRDHAVQSAIRSAEHCLPLSLHVVLLDPHVRSTRVFPRAIIVLFLVNDTRTVPRDVRSSDGDKDPLRWPSTCCVNLCGSGIKIHCESPVDISQMTRVAMEILLSDNFSCAHGFIPCKRRTEHTFCGKMKVARR